MAARLPSKLSSKENIEKQCLMDTLQIRDPTKLTKPKSHSSICLTSPTENKSFEADSMWSKGSSPVLARESSLSGVDLPSRYAEGTRKHRDRGDGDALREVPLCRVGDIHPGVSGGGEPSLIVMVKGESVNELSKKARWIIIITAVVLVLMSILLVGITLRLAPVIDDLVRKENEESHFMIKPHTTPRPLESFNRTMMTTTSSGHPDG